MVAEAEYMDAKRLVQHGLDKVSIMSMFAQQHRVNSIKKEGGVPQDGRYRRFTEIRQVLLLERFRQCYGDGKCY